MSDSIDRQAAIDAINKLIDRFERILHDIRETNGDESVCGLCEYDGAFIGQSGDWCNECPGFDKADCFKLSDKCRKTWLEKMDLPSAQTELHYDEWCSDCREYDKERHCCPRFNKVIRETVEEYKAAQPEPCEDAVSRKAAIDVLNINRNPVFHDSVDYGGAMYDICKLPSVTPKQRWIPVTLETLPNPNSVVVVCGKKGTWDYGTYRGWHGDIHSWWWKKKTIKHVYWWMYKEYAMSLPYREEGD